MAIVKGGIDTEVKEVKIPKYKATKSTTDRGTLFQADTWKIVARTHYIKGIGTVHCWDGLCCKLNGEPKISNIYPLIKYPATKSGDLILQGEPELLRLELSNKKDKSIRTKHKIAKDQGKDLSKMDILLVGAEESQKIESSYVDKNGNKPTIEYYDFTFEGPVSDSPGFMKNKNWMPIIKEQWDFYKENIVKTLGRVIENDEEYNKIIQEINVQNNTQQQFKTTNIQSAKALPISNVSETNIGEVSVDDMFFEEETPKKQKLSEVKNATVNLTKEVKNDDEIDMKFFED
jgi:hypothetical protein